MKRKTKKQIIEETAAAYTDSTTALDCDSASCLYLTSDGRKCAVGRMLTEEGLEVFEGKNGLGFNASSFKEKCKERNFPFTELYKEEYRGHSGEFLDELQQLHDLSAHWDEKGLTDDGYIYKNYLLDRWVRRKKDVIKPPIIIDKTKNL